MYQRGTKILSVRIKEYMHDLIRDVTAVLDPRRCDMGYKVRVT